MKKYWIIVILLIVAVVLFSNKKSEVKESEIVDTPSTETEAKNISEAQKTSLVASKSESNIPMFTVQGGNFYFKPNIIKVKQGDTVTINFKNDGGMHDFVIDEFKVATKKLASGVEEKVTFVADKKGSFEYYCSVGSHRQMGMKGTLIVE